MGETAGARWMCENGGEAGAAAKKTGGIAVEAAGEDAGDWARAAGERARERSATARKVAPRSMLALLPTIKASWQ